MKLGKSYFMKAIYSFHIYRFSIEAAIEVFSWAYVENYLVPIHKWSFNALSVLNDMI